MKRSLLTQLLFGFAVVATAAIAFYFYMRPTWLRVAVVRGSADHQLMQAAARLQDSDRASVRFTLVPVNDSAAAIRALDTGNTDMAIGPSDQPLPATGKTVVVMRRHAVVLLAPAGGKFSSLADLAGKTIGIVKDESSNTGHNRILDAILARHDMAETSLKRVLVDVASVPDMLSSQKVDAIMVTGIPGDGAVGDVVHAIARAGKGEPVFIPVGHTNALAQHSSAFEQFAIPAGTFAGANARPPQELDTIAYSVRLFASVNLRDSTVGAVTRAMFSQKPRLALQYPLALRMSAPSTNKDAALPTHPGAAAYLDGEEQSFFDRFSEFFYLGAMVLSIVGSAVAAAASHLRFDSKREYRDHVARLIEILRLARLAEDASMLRLLQLETDNIFAEFMTAAARGRHDETRVANLGILVGQVHQALLDRRAALEGARAGMVTATEQLREPGLREAS